MENDGERRDHGENEKKRDLASRENRIARDTRQVSRSRMMFQFVRLALDVDPSIRRSASARVVRCSCLKVRSNDGFSRISLAEFRSGERRRHVKPRALTAL